MAILFTQPPVATAVSGPVSPLNAIWVGTPHTPFTLPQLGHMLLILPLAETAVFCDKRTILPSQYMLLTPKEDTFSVQLTLFQPTRLLLLWLSPPFITDMAHFLNIPSNLPQLLNGVPLLQGDQLSVIAAELAAATHTLPSSAILADHFLEVVGEVIHLMRLRHQALQRLTQHKQSTIDDLLPRLLQARQYVEAQYTQQFKTATVANHVGLSEFHFARLFKTAFDTTLRQQIIQLRLDEARRLLEQPETAVTTTAFQVGYGSLSSFIHAFAKKFGVSPSQYQAQAKMSRI